MQHYLIIKIIIINLIIFKLINSKRFKFNKNLLSIFCIIQFILIILFYLNNNKIIIFSYCNSFISNLIILIENISKLMKINKL